MAGDAQTTGLGCTACGAPLAPQGNAVRVSCSYCGAINEIASAGAVRVAKKLEQFGIRVPERPMTIEEIEAELAGHRNAERERRRMALIVATVVALAVVLVLVLVMVGSAR
jgi:hypothetical protein